MSVARTFCGVASSLRGVADYRGPGVDFEESAGPVTADQVAGIEQRLRVTLPSPYRTVLEHANGGFLKPNYFNHDVVVRQLFSVGQSGIDQLEDVESINDEFATRGSADYVLPDALLAVGGDDFGNLLCVSLSERDAGIVYFWDHEIPEDEQAQRSLDVHLPELLTALRPLTELQAADSQHNE